MLSWLSNPCRRESGEGGAEGVECVLGVVAGADGFGEAGGAFGLEAGEEDGGLDLCARDRGGEVDGVESRAGDRDGRVSVLTRSSFAPIWLSGLRMRSMGRRVSEWSPIEREGARMRGDQAGEHTHGGAGVAAVERRGGLAKGAGGAGDFDDAGGAFAGVRDLGAERFHAGERGVWVGAGGEVGEAGGAFGEAGEHGVAVRDGLVAGNGEGALQRAGGADDLRGHSSFSVANPHWP